MPYKNVKIENNEEKSSKNWLQLGLLISSAVVGFLALVFCLVLNLADTNEAAYKVFAGLSIALPLVAIAVSALCIVKRDKKTYALILPIILITCCAMIFAGGIYGCVAKNPTVDQPTSSLPTPTPPSDDNKPPITLDPSMSFEEIRTALTDIKNFTVTEGDSALFFRENGMLYSNGTETIASFYDGTRYYSISVGGGEDTIKIVDYSGYSYDFSDMGAYTALKVLDGWGATETDVSVPTYNELICTRDGKTRKISGINTTEFDIPDKFKDYKTMSATNSVLKTQAITDDTCAVIGAETYVTAIEIPELIDGKAVVKIVDNAFNGHTKLASVKISNSITTLGVSAFSGCTKLSNVTFGNNCQLTSISEGAFDGCTALKNITIPSGITTIKSTAFHGCTSLTSLVLPNSVAYVETGAFNSSGLTSVTIPNGVKSIDNVTFGYCSELESVTIPKSVTEIGSMAFVDCGKLAAIYYDGTESDWDKVIKDPTWDDNAGDYLVYFVTEKGQLSYAKRSQGDGYVVTGIGDHSGSELVIPETRNGKPIVGIKDSAFADCSELMNVTIPSGVTSIGSDAFKNCFKLIEVCNKSQLWIEKGSEEYGGVAYYAKNVYEEGGESKLSTDSGGFIIYEDVREKVLVDYVGTAKDITLPSGVTSIYDYAFYNRTDLTNVTISSDVVSIGGYAFSGCSGLTTVTVPDSVTRIGVTAFSNCARLTDVTIGGGVTYIGYKAFDGCVKLIEVYNKSALSLTVGSSDNGEVAYYAKNVYTTEGGNKLSTDDNGYVIYSDGADKIFIGYRGSETALTLPDGITKIHTYALYSDSNTESVIIPVSVKGIVKDAFYDCTALAQITYNGTLAQWNQVNKELDWDEGTDNYTIGYKDLAYELNAEKTAYTVTGIGTYEGTEITIPATYANLPVTAIKDSAFMDNTTITSVSISDNVTSIGDSAFANCNMLTAISIPECITSIGNNAFNTCANLATINFADTNAKWNAITKGTDWNKNAGAYTIVYKDLAYELNAEKTEYTVTGIGTYEGTNIIVPSTYENLPVTAIQESAFKNNTAITSVSIANSVTSIGYGAFSGCNSISTMTVSAGNVDYHVADNCLVATKTKILIWGCDSSVIPNDGSVTSIGDSAFASCNSLTSISIPKCITSIGNNAFNACASLATINYADTNAKWNAITKGADWNKNTSAYTITYKDLAYALNSEGTAYTVTGVGTYEGTDIIIPATYENLPVIAIERFAFMNNSAIESVTIQNNLTIIDDYAFAGCIGLIKVIISETVTDIGDCAFVACIALRNVIFNGNSQLNSIGAEAFYHCRNIINITIPTYVTRISEGAFQDCYRLVEVYNKSSLDISAGSLSDDCIGRYAKAIYTDSYTSRLSIDKDGYIVYTNDSDSILVGYIGDDTALVLPDGITSINQYAFFGDENITSITIPDSLASIGDYAFYGCYRLLEVYNKSSLNIVAEGYDNGCIGYYAKLVSNEPYDSKVYTDKNGYIIYKDGIERILVGYTGEDVRLCLPDGITGINQGAFGGKKGILSISIPDSVISIGDSAFSECTGLENITFGANSQLSSIGYGAFSWCVGLTNITIPRGVTSIGRDAFEMCVKLVVIYNLSSLSIIAGSSDYGYVGYYAKSVYSSTHDRALSTDNSGYVFYNSGANKMLVGYTGTETELTLPSGISEINQGAFCQNLNLKKVIIPDGVKHIGDGAFYGCASLTNVLMPESLKSIGAATFEMCLQLKDVGLPNNLESIGEGAFMGCVSMEYIAIPNRVTYIGGYAFALCTDIKNATIGNGVVSVEEGMFYGCTSLISISINEGATEIADYTFYGCISLNNLTMPKTITKIGRVAFCGCKSLKNLIIPDNVIDIGYGAFSECTGLTSIAIPSKVKIIGERAFSGCSSLTKVIIGKGVEKIGQWAFELCTSLTNVLFEDPTTWYRTGNYSDWNNKTNGTATDVSNAGSNATYFTSTTYCSYYWYKL